MTTPDPSAPAQSAPAPSAPDQSAPDSSADARAPEPPMRFSPGLAVVMLTFTVGSTVLWYQARREGWMPLDRKTSVAVLYWVGLLVWFGCLWAFRGVAPWRLRRETWLVPISATLFLTLFWMYGRSASYRIWFGPPPRPGGLTGLYPFFYLVGCSVLFRIALPVITGRALMGRRPGDYGYTLKGAFRRWWIYAGLTALVIPAVIWASSQKAFLRTYPWCKRAIEGGAEIDGGVFLLYAVILFAFYASGEAFWRGYILLGSARETGANALFMMLMPYVLGHLGKPLPETLGAVAAGLVLGALALHHRSFWLGAVTHWTIAMTMDLAALWRRGVAWVW